MAVLRNSTHAPFMKKRFSVEEIKKRVVGEPFELVSTEYLNAHEKLDWKCYACGGVFRSNWVNISSGWGCGICRKIELAEKMRGKRLGIDAVRNYLKDKTISVLDDVYVSVREKMSFRCDVCGHTWKTNFSTLKLGYGCWVCTRPRGEKHFNWRGGVGTNPYPKEWTEELKSRVRMRDDNKCQYPDCNYDGERKLHVHHINGIKEDCRELNLISLCLHHHMSIEANRPENWQDYFYSITADYEWERV